MTVLRGFPGLVIGTEWADSVTTGPYDAYTPKQRAALAEANPYSFLHVTRSQEDVPADKQYIDGTEVFPMGILLALCKPSRSFTQTPADIFLRCLNSHGR